MEQTVQQERRIHASTADTWTGAAWRNRPYAWSDFIVGRMLSKPEYMGHTVNFHSHKAFYKDNQPVYHASEDWMIFLL